jgi:hypothetical protein
LLTFAQDPNSDIRQYAVIGLVFCMPEKYIVRFFATIMDTSEGQEYRRNLAGALHLYTGRLNRNLLRDYKKDLYNCLSVTDREGHPIDEIRILMWRMINELYGEEASITLGPNSKNSVSTLRNLLADKLIRENLPVEERYKRANDKLNKILTVLPNDSEVKK